MNSQLGCNRFFMGEEWGGVETGVGKRRPYTHQLNCTAQLSLVEYVRLSSFSGTGMTQMFMARPSLEIIADWI